MPILTSDFAALTDDLQEIFEERAATRIAELKGLQVFDVRDTDRRTYDYLVMHGVDVISRVAEGSDLPKASTEQGDTATWTQTRYGGIVAITKDMRMFDLFDRIEGQAIAAVDDAFDKIDYSLADVLTNGWSTSYTDPYNQSITSTGVDGLALFSTAHTNGTTGTTFRNQIRLKSSSTENPALSRQAVIDARVDAMTYTDPNGQIRPINLDTLLVPPSKQDLAMRIVNSPGVQGTDNVDVNDALGGVNVQTWERLENTSQGTSRSDYWFMYDSRNVGETLKALFAERPSLDPPDQAYRSKNWDYSLDYYYAIGRGFPAYVWGSQGDGN